MNKFTKTLLSFLLTFLLLLPYTTSLAKTVTDTLDNESNNSNSNSELITIYYSEKDYWKSKENSEISLYSTFNSDNNDKLKEFIYSELKNLKSTIDISKFCTNLTTNNISSIFNLYFDLLYENPDIFYTDNRVRLGYSYNSNGNITSCSLYVSYPYDSNTLNKMINTFSSKINEIKNNYLDGINDPLQLEYEIYDYIINNNKYDWENFNNNTIPELSYTAYGALVNGVSVCEGYAKAAKLLFNIVGIESGIIVSNSMNHAWNYVKINDNYYHLDITWDDPSYETGKRDYKYFNLSDTEMSQDHQWPSTYPSCTSSNFSFLHNINEDRYFRLKDKIYYSNSDGTVYFMDINGDNKTLLISDISTSNIIGYNNTLYMKYNGQVYKYNLSLKNLETFNTDIPLVYDLDIVNGILKAYTYSNEVLKFDLKIAEDINCDGLVDILDLSSLSLNYNLSSSSSSWKSRFDLNNDNIIDLFDITILSKKL